MIIRCGFSYWDESESESKRKYKTHHFGGEGERNTRYSVWPHIYPICLREKRKADRKRRQSRNRVVTALKKPSSIFTRRPHVHIVESVYTYI